MKPSTLPHAVSVSQAVAKGVCPICGILEDFHRELAGEVERAMFAQWLKSQGSLCLEHARKLKEYVPLKHQRLLDEVVARNRDELRQEPMTFREPVRQGTHADGGLLGRAAEFLVGQRGL